MGNMTISGKNFSWNKDHGTAYVSDIGSFLTFVPHKFSVRGKREVVDFGLRRVARDYEGDIQAWDFISNDGRFTLTVFND